MINLHENKTLTLKQIYLEIFAASQYEVGHLWQEHLINVGDEHYCTAATQMIMSRFYPMLFNGTPKDYGFVGVCAEGNNHELPLRIVTDFFEMEGWIPIISAAVYPKMRLSTFYNKHPAIYWESQQPYRNILKTSKN